MAYGDEVRRLSAAVLCRSGGLVKGMLSGCRPQTSMYTHISIALAGAAALARESGRAGHHLSDDFPDASGIQMWSPWLPSSTFRRL